LQGAYRATVTVRCI